ncbi:MAG: ribosome silencing factor [Nitrospinae bacterium]|nr:ribosome silencing factor [Nitrospinota bacterium]
MPLTLEEKTRLCYETAQDKKAYDLVILDLRKYSYVTDYFIICSGSSTVQVQAIADAIDEKLGKEGIRPLGREGYSEAHWVLLDYADVVIHIFHEETRKFYDLERLWGDAAAGEIPG